MAIIDSFLVWSKFNMSLTWAILCLAHSLFGSHRPYIVLDTYQNFAQNFFLKNDFWKSALKSSWLKIKFN